MINNNPVPMQPSYATRVTALRTALAKAGKRLSLDALLIADSVNICYLTGFTGSTAMVIVTRDEALLITDGRYTTQAALQSPGFTLIEAGSSGGYNDVLGDTLKERAAIQRIGFDGDIVTVNQIRRWRKAAPSARWVLAESYLADLRNIKDESEIARLREAVRLAQAAFAAVQDKLAPGISERDLALELEYTMRRMGAEGPSFDTIVASGPNGAFPHHHAGERRLEAGDLVTIDWGAKVNGYCSDITRTIAVPGKPVDETLRNIHQIVLDSLNLAIAGCIAGANGKAVDSIARDHITAAGYGDQFKHSLGHSIGRDVHDGPALAQRSANITLKPSMVITVEPGIYVDGLGGVRIEEDVLVTEKGPVVLTERSGGLA